MFCVVAFQGAIEERQSCHATSFYVGPEHPLMQEWRRNQRRWQWRLRVAHLGAGCLVCYTVLKTISTLAKEAEI